MKGITRIKKDLLELIVALEAAQHTEAATKLRRSMGDLDQEDSCLLALEEISGLCHIRGLGDMYMPEFSGWDWPNKVGELKQKCQRAIKRIKQV